MMEKLASVEKRYEEIEQLLAEPEVSTDYPRVQSLAKEQASLKSLTQLYREYRKLHHDLEETQALSRDSSDQDMANLAREEVSRLEARRDAGPITRLTIARQDAPTQAATDHMPCPLSRSCAKPVRKPAAALTAVTARPAPTAVNVWRTRTRTRAGQTGVSSPPAAALALDFWRAVVRARAWGGVA